MITSDLQLSNKVQRSCILKYWDILGCLAQQCDVPDKERYTQYPINRFVIFQQYYTYPEHTKYTILTIPGKFIPEIVTTFSSKVKLKDIEWDLTAEEKKQCRSIYTIYRMKMNKNFALPVVSISLIKYL